MSDPMPPLPQPAVTALADRLMDEVQERAGKLMDAAFAEQGVCLDPDERITLLAAAGYGFSATIEALANHLLLDKKRLSALIRDTIEQS